MKIKDIKLENSLWSAQLTIVSDDRQELERIFENAGKVDPEKEYTVTIKQRRNKRSLDANAYMWVLLGKLAEKLRTSSDELYIWFIRQYGVYESRTVVERAIESAQRRWNKIGKGWFVDDMGPSTTYQGCRNLRFFYGSSSYDTKEMARLIDEVVEECKAQGIETMSKKEIDNLLGGQKNE